MLKLLSTTYQARELLWAFIEREIKTRYRRSFLGLLWSLITPLYQVALMTVVVKMIWHKPDDDYSVKVLCGLVVWTFFSSGITTSCASFLRSRDLVKRVPLPRQIIPWSVVGSCFFHLAMSIVVLMVLLVIIPIVIRTPGQSFRPQWLSWETLFLPVLVGLELMMVMGIALILSLLHTMYHDVEYIVTNLVGAFYFLTPIIWNIDPVWVESETVRALIWYNPMATYCEGVRGIIMRHELPPLGPMLTTGAFSILCFIVGLWFFRRREWQLPEVV